MKSFDQQEKDTATRRLRELLLRVKAPVKAQADWDRLENNVFAALDNEKQPARTSQRPALSRFFLSLPRFSIAHAAAAALILSVAGVGLHLAYRSAIGTTAASLISLQGHVAVRWDGKGAWDTLSSIGPLSQKAAMPGTEFSPLAASSAVILLDKGSVVKVFEKSLLTIKDASASQQTCFLATGSVLVKVNKLLPGRRFEIRTPCAACGVVGTIFRVDANGAAATTLSVYQGKVRMSPQAGPPSSATVVATGRQMTMARDGAVAFGRITEKITPIRDISVLSMLVEHPENAGGGDAAVVDITSSPDGAKVMINNNMAGITPLLVREMPGTYGVALFADGCAPYEGKLVVGCDRVVSLAADLAATVALAPSAASPRRRIVSAVSQRKQTEQELLLIPDYVEALVNMSSGEYQQALAILDSLSTSGMIDIRQRMCIMETVNACYAKLGDFEHASDVLEERLQKTDSPKAKGQILWELANMRANCLGDYEGAEMALVEFLILQPDATWAHDAYRKLAETQYYLGKYKSAAETYQEHIRTFPDDPDIDHSMFNLACILGRDMDDYEKAAGWYTRLLNSFHASKYRSAALFRRAECFMELGKTDDAIKDYRAYLALEPEGIWRSICIGTLKKYKVL
jgi:tetratricopeptide (TPR) repeat protein